MPDIGKWSPIRIPDAFRTSAQQTDPADPTDSWDASDWDEPDQQGFFARLKPNHTGQWFILGALLAFAMGAVFYVGQFFPLASGNPWTLVATLWPASLLVVYVKGREDGFLQNKRLDWTFALDGSTLRVFPGKFVERFGEGDHVKFTPLKTRSYGAFSFKWLKLGDLEQNRDNLISKASGSNREPDSPANFLLPGALTGETSDTVLGRVFGVHSGGLTWHDRGRQTDMRFTNPSNLDEGIAADVLNQLELLDNRVIPELKETIQTVETQKEQYKERAEAERDPELDRIFGAVDKISDIVNNSHRNRRNSDDEDDDVEEITERAKNQVQG